MSDIPSSADVKAHSKALSRQQILAIKSPTARLVRMLESLDHGISERVTTAMGVVSGSDGATLREMLEMAADEINQEFSYADLTDTNEVLNNIHNIFGGVGREHAG